MITEVLRPTYYYFNTASFPDAKKRAQFTCSLGSLLLFVNSRSRLVLVLSETPEEEEEEAEEEEEDEENSSDKI